MPAPAGSALLAGGAACSARRCGGAGTRRRAPTRSASGWRRRTRSSRASACARSSSRAPGERLLEVGPGTGYYRCPVAEWLAPAAGSTCSTCSRRCSTTRMRRARRRESRTSPDARRRRELPYGDDSFDGAYLVTVLGEIPDQDAALRELRRVVGRAAASWSASCSATRTWSPTRRWPSGPAMPGLRWSASSAARSGTSPGCKPDCTRRAFRPEPLPAWRTHALRASHLQRRGLRRGVRGVGRARGLRRHGLRGLRLHPPAAGLRRGVSTIVASRAARRTSSRRSRGARLGGRLER